MDREGRVICAFRSDGSAVVFDMPPSGWGQEFDLSSAEPYSEEIDYREDIPQAISRFQARAALLDAGLLADVEIALADADPLTQLAWAEAIEWRRDSPTIAAIGDALGLTEEDIDDLFIEADKIKA